MCPPYREFLNITRYFNLFITNSRVLHENIFLLSCREYSRRLSCIRPTLPLKANFYPDLFCRSCRVLLKTSQILSYLDLLWRCQQIAHLSLQAPSRSYFQGSFLLCSGNRLLCVWSLHERHNFLPNEWKIDCHGKSLLGILLAGEDLPSTAWARCFLVLPLLLINTLLRYWIMPQLVVSYCIVI